MMEESKNRKADRMGTAADSGPSWDVDADDLLDAAFDQRIHDAYESVGLSAEAEDRILSALLAAQAERDALDRSETADRTVAVKNPAFADGPDAQSDVIPFRKRPRIPALIPIAASLLLAFVIGRAVIPGPSAAPSNDSTAPAQTQDAAEIPGSSVGDKSAEENEASESANASEAPQASMPGEASFIVDGEEEFSIRSARFDDGRIADIVFEDDAPVVIAPEFAGESLGRGCLLDSMGGESLPVEFFACDSDLYDEDAFCLIRADGDSTFYLARIAV